LVQALPGLRRCILERPNFLNENIMDFGPGHNLGHFGEIHGISLYAFSVDVIVPRDTKYNRWNDVASGDDSNCGAPTYGNTIRGNYSACSYAAQYHVLQRANGLTPAA